MKILITGACGMLGSEVSAAAYTRKHEVIALNHGEFDITDPVTSGRFIAGEFGDLDLVINCAAYTAVDLAEEQPDQAYAVNALGVAYLAKACMMSGVKLIHFSTDYVFDGSATVPYAETEAPSPLGVYGMSKRQGEEAILDSGAPAWILRTSWLIGPLGKNFLRTMVSRKDDDLGIVDDQWGTPTYAPFLAEKVMLLIEQNPPPDVFHASGSEVMTWFQLAQAIKDYLPDSLGDRIAISTDQYPTLAKRPRYSALDSTRFEALVGKMPTLKSALDHYFSSCTQS